jgi:hypothetical protein
MKTVLSTFVVGLMALMLSSPASAHAGQLNTLEAEVAALQGQVTALQGQNTALQTEVTALKNAINSKDAQNAFALGQFVTVDTTDTINGLAGPHIIFTGANLHVRDGSGATDDNGGALTGLGNLVIGYDDAPASPAAGYRSGVHNLVVGPHHAFSSFGGFVAGDNNTVEGPDATVSGGNNNTAGGFDSSVSGGKGNTAIQFGATVSGGFSNIANGITASVSGGANNQAAHEDASISGGEFNTASQIGASISGGNFNQATAFDSSVSGGSHETASGQSSAVGGGVDGQNASGTNEFLP